MKKNFVWLMLMLPITALAQIIYTSPMPGSRYHNPETGILLRSMEAMDASLLAGTEILVTGSLSGRHDVETKLLKQGHLLQIKPLARFVEGEEVRVEMRGAGLKSESGHAIDVQAFSFFIREPRTAEMKERIARQMQEIYAEEFSRPSSYRSLGPAKPGLPEFTILENTTESPGMIFFSDFNFYLLDNAYYCVINNDGDSIFGKWDTTVFNNFDLNRNGFMTAYNRIDSVFVMFDSNYNAIKTYQMGNGYRSDVHEFVILPDGSRFMFCYDPQVIDMTQYDPDYYPEATVIGCVLQELDESDNVLFQWRSWDHIPITDADHINLAAALIDAVHSNAIDIDSDGNILLTSRHLSEVTKIDRITGQIIWRLGSGNGNEFTFIGDDEKFSFPHDARRIANGNLTIFDNGNHHIPPKSTAKEYMIDEANKTATLVWSYSRTTPQGPIFSSGMGNTQRLSNGNTLICWGLVNLLDDVPKMTEVDPEGNIVWELKLSDQDAVYRAHRYDWIPCARPSASSVKASNITATTARLNWKPATNATTFEVRFRKSGTIPWTTGTFPTTSLKLKNLLPSTKYEYQIRSNCTNAGAPNSGWTDMRKFKTLPQRLEDLQQPIAGLEVYPNPAQENLSLEYTLEEPQQVQIRILDATGRTLETFTSDAVDGVNTEFVNIRVLPPGFFFIEMIVNGTREVRPFVKE